MLPIHLGKTYLQLQQLSQAKQYLNQALDIFQRLEQIYDEMKVLLSLGEFYRQNNEYSLAFESCQQALNIAQKLKVPWIKKCQKLIKQIQTKD